MLIIFSFIVSCGDEKGIEQEKLAMTYVDLLVVEDFYADSDSLEFKRAQVFEKYAITEEFYDSTFKRMKYDTENWDNFFSIANEYLDSLKKEVKNGNLKKLP